MKLPKIEAQTLPLGSNNDWRAPGFVTRQPNRNPVEKQEHEVAEFYGKYYSGSKAISFTMDLTHYYPSGKLRQMSGELILSPEQARELATQLILAAEQQEVDAS